MGRAASYPLKSLTHSSCIGTAGRVPHEGSCAMAWAFALWRRITPWRRIGGPSHRGRTCIMLTGASAAPVHLILHWATPAPTRH